MGVFMPLARLISRLFTLLFIANPLAALAEQAIGRCGNDPTSGTPCIIKVQAGDATLDVHFVDASGLPFASGFRVLDLDQVEVFSVAAGAQAPWLAPGRYVLEPDFDPSRAVVFEVGTDTVQPVVIEAPDRLMLTVEEGGAGRRQVAFFPLARLDRAAAFATRRLISRTQQTVAVPRSTVALLALPEHLEQARLAFEQHRTTLVRLAQLHADQFAIDKAQSEATIAIRSDWNLSRIGLEAALAILSAAGTREDATRLAEAAVADHRLIETANPPRTIPGDHLRKLWRRELAAASHIEARLARLGSGELRALTEFDNTEVAVAAAVLLHRYGDWSADQQLVDYLAAPTPGSLVGEVAEVLLDRDHPVILGEMVQYLSRALRTQEKGEAGDRVLEVLASRPAALYLLAYGEAAQWRLVRSMSAALQKSLVIDAAALSMDPRGLMEDTAFAIAASEHLKYTFAEDAALFARFCPAIRAWHPEDRRYLDGYRHRLWQAVGVSANISGKTEGSDQLTSDAVLSMQETFCRASQRASEILFEARDNDYLGPVTWYPHPQYDAKVPPVERWQRRAEYQLEQLAPDEIVMILQRPEMDLGRARDIFLTAHRLVDRSQMSVRSPYDQGRDWRAFVLRDDAEGQLVSGLVNLLPLRTHNGFAFEIGIDAAGYVPVTLIDGPGAGQVEAIAAGNTGLIDDVHLVRDGTPITLERQATDRDDMAVFSTTVPDLRGAYFFVTLALGDARQVLVYDVFSNPGLRKPSSGGQ